MSLGAPESITAHVQFYGLKGFYFFFSGVPERLRSMSRQAGSKQIFMMRFDHYFMLLVAGPKCDNKKKEKKIEKEKTLALRSPKLAPRY